MSKPSQSQDIEHQNTGVSPRGLPKKPTRDSGEQSAQEKLDREAELGTDQTGGKSPQPRSNTPATPHR